MYNQIAKILKEKYNGKLIKKTYRYCIFYIDDTEILDSLFNFREKERHKYNAYRLKNRREYLEYQENTLIGKLLIIKIYFNNNKSFALTPSCEEMEDIIKSISK